MSNIKLVNNYWATSGLYDITQGKTQSVFNSEILAGLSATNSNITELTSILSDINYSEARVVTTANASLSSYTSGGIWYFGSSYIPADAPSGANTWGYLIVLKSGTNPRLVQIWINTVSVTNSVYFRSSDGQTISWSSWKKVFTSSDLNDIIAKNIPSLTVSENVSKGEFRIYDGSLYHLKANIASGSPIVAGTNAEITNLANLNICKQLAIVNTSPLPANVISTKVIAYQAGNVVNVQLIVQRNSTAITGYQTIATGFPEPIDILKDNSAEPVPFGYAERIGSTSSSTLQCIVSTNGELKIRRGNASDSFYVSFIYLTNDFSHL